MKLWRLKKGRKNKSISKLRNNSNFKTIGNYKYE